jgi:glycerophosphoryl diester phosphodiesterase
MHTKLTTSTLLATALLVAALPGSAHASAKPSPPRPLAITPRTSSVNVKSLPQHFFTAHRGDGSFLAPENTEAALAAGVANPDADLLEFDVQSLADGNGGIWHDDTVDRISTTRGNVHDLTTAQFKKLVINAPAWFGGTSTTSHPLLLDELLNKFAGKKLLLAHAKDTAAMNIVIDEVTRYHLTGSVLTQTTSRSDAALAHRAGLTSQVIIMTTHQGTVDTPQAILADGIPRVSIKADLPDALIARYVASGLTVSCWNVNSQYRRDQLYRLGVQGIDSDDPTYIRGNTSRYHRTSDPFATHTWTPGQLGQDQAANTLNPTQRGIFTTPNLWSIPASTTPLFDRQGWASPLPGLYNLRAQIRFDHTSTDKTRWAGLYFSAVYDHRYSDAASDPQNAGYSLILRQNGQLQLFRKDPNGTVLLKTVQTPAIKSGTTAKISLHITAAGIYFRRYDTHVKGVTVPDTTYRGPYLYLGRSADPGHPGPATSFSDIAFF